MTHRTRSLALSVPLLATLLLAACGSGSSSGAGPALSSITVSPAAVPLHPGETLQLTVTGFYDDGSSAPVTSSATFGSPTPSVATVSAAGLITAVGPGTATVTASLSGKAAQATVTVTSLTQAGVVFADDYSAGVAFVAFVGSTNALSVDAGEHHTGTAALRIAVPAAGWTGGALVSASAQDLSWANALTFWARASKAATLNVTGIGNDASGGTTLSAESAHVPLTTDWVKHAIPLPAPSRATASNALFHLAEGSEEGAYTIWIDDIQYENLSGAALAAPTAAAVGWPTITVGPGEASQMDPGSNTVTYALPALPDGGKLTKVGFRWFTLASSDETKATANADGLVTGIAAGTASITARIGTLDAPGAASVTVSAGGVLAPTEVAAAPTADPAEVISLSSSTYAGTAGDRSASVDTWFTPWSGAGGSLTDPYLIPGTGHAVKKYVLKNYAGVEFIGAPAGANEIDIATPGMTHLHMDVWSPDGSHLVLKLIDAGPDALVGEPPGPDDSAKITLGGITLPGQSRWVPLDIAIAGMGVQNGAWTGKNVAQMVIALDTPIPGGTLFVDNVYFYRSSGGGVTGPPDVAAAPTAAAADVISLFGSTYTGGIAGGDYSGRVDSYASSCFGPPGTTVFDHTIAGTSHVVKQYGINANEFAIIELIGATGGIASPPDSVLCHGGTQTGANLTDVSAMTALHFDVWTPDGSENFQVQLVNADAGTLSGPGQGAGATPGTTASSGANTVAVGSWVAFDVPLASLSPAIPGAGFRELALLKLFTTQPGTFFVDNVYFHR
jgi:hypothetical protein